MAIDIQLLNNLKNFTASSSGNTTGIFDYEKIFSKAKEIYDILLKVLIIEN